MAERTLQAMAVGGMRDHVGGGFHRYSVDADWRVPHFEKMLYDQAQLVIAYLEAYQASGQIGFADVAADTLAYVSRDMTDAGGGFFSAEDADSVPPDALLPARKTEGAFYLWSFDEIAGVVGPDAELVRARFGIEPGGNAPFDTHNEFGAGNLLYAAQDLDALARRFGEDAAGVLARLEAARQQMFAARAARPRPHLDDKILTAWNGLMIAAFARGARVLGRADWLAAAVKAASFLRSRLWDAQSRTLLRRHRAGESAIPGYADDYANTVWGLLELFQSGGDVQWLEWAADLQRRQDELFWDESGGGWFSTTGHDASVLLRLKEDYDGAEPAATSVGAGNLLVLAHLTGDGGWRARLDDVFGAFADRLASGGRAAPLMMAALSAYHAGVQQLVIVGPRGDAGTAALAAVAAGRYLPFAVTAVIDPDADLRRLGELAPALAAMTMKDGRPTAYWCRDFVCQAPTTDPRELERMLAAGR
jgi:hypothetical protein